jgi:hypothetical protein
MNRTDLPMVADEDDMRRVHNANGLYFLSTGLVAHSDLDCWLAAENPAKLIRNPKWRVASDAHVRSLKGSWCQACCA